MSLQSAVSTDDFRLREVDGVPLCTDSTSDNEEEMLFQLKTRSRRKKIADSQAWHTMQQAKGKKRKKTDDVEKFIL